MRVRLIKDYQFGQDGPRIGTDGTAYQANKMGTAYGVIFDGFDADGVFFVEDYMVEILDD